MPKWRILGLPTLCPYRRYKCSIVKAREKQVQVLIRVCALISCNTKRNYQVSQPYSPTILKNIHSLLVVRKSKVCISSITQHATV